MNSIPTFGPIFQLQFFGTICPCLQKSEDANARQSVNEINKSCQRIQWIRDHNSGSSSSNTNFSISGFFAKATTTITNGDSSDNATTKNRLARITLHDSGHDGQPELFIDPILSDSYNNNDNDVVTTTNDDPNSNKSPKMKSQNASSYNKLNIKLRRVDKVSLDDSTGHIILLSKATTRDGIKYPAKELLRFVLLLDTDKQSKSTTSTSTTTTTATATTTTTQVTSDQRNLIVHHYMVICEWERQRRSMLSATDAYESDDDDDDIESGPNFLSRRAQKATHFARREIELQQTKRTREQRKSQLIQQSGGLKYTAIAMANREIS